MTETTPDWSYGPMGSCFFMLLPANIQVDTSNGWSGGSGSGTFARSSSMRLPAIQPRQIEFDDDEAITLSLLELW